MLERYKKQFNGEKKLAELIETTMPVRQKQIVQFGLKEDRFYMESALQYVIEWEDILKMDKLELSDLMHRAKTKANVIATAISDISPEKQKEFLVCCEREVMGRVKDALEYKGNITQNTILTARISLISLYRELINDGVLKQFTKDKSEMVKKFKSE
ncbi:MAG: hypothetical protein JXA66_06975 [Oligoflexia bacterium]|nr:hypothetical protein [Oligoflexia bacterium]